MFNGDFRSRREIDYSGGTSRRGNRGRASSQRKSAAASTASSRREALLKNAEAQRKQRHEQQRREKCSKIIQKVVRGRIARKRVLQDLQQQSNAAKGGSVSTSMLVSNIALQLSPQMQPKNADPSHVKQLLLIYSKSSIASAPSQPPNASKPGTGTSTAWFSQKRIAHTALYALQSTIHEAACTEEERASMFSILQSYFATFLNNSTSTATSPAITINEILFMDLIRCCKRFWTEVVSCLQAAKVGSTASSHQRQITSMTKQLLQWCHEVRLHLQTKTAGLSELLQAAIATIFLTATPATSTSSTSSKPKSKLIWMKPILLQTLLPVCMQSTNYYQAWIESLIPVLSQQNDAGDNGDGGGGGSSTSNIQSMIRSFVMKQLVGKESTVLQYALHLLQQSDATAAPSKPHALLYLLNHVFSKDSQLAFLTSLAARGEDIRLLSAASSASSSKSSDEATAAMSDPYLDSDDEDEEDEEDAPINKKTRRSTARYSRKDLSTIPKLDRMYQNEIQQQRQSLISGGAAVSPDIIEMAYNIGQNSKQWLEWGLMVLSPTDNNVANSATATDNASTSPTSTSTLIQDAYLDLLHQLLQSCSGIRTNSRMSSSSFLSAIGFSRPFLSKLWSTLQQHLAQLQNIIASTTTARDVNYLYIQQEQKTIQVFTIFCDLFSHHLISLNDQEFVNQYANDNDTMAQDIIIHLRDVLYQLYWTKPVLITDLKTSSRFRLLLSGTKLWNALLERWNRISIKFCDESIWWFPYLSSRDGDGAVILGGIGNDGDGDHDHAEDGSNADMDDDSDDSDGDNDGDDDAMDVDEDGVNAAQDVTMDAADSEANALAGSFRDPKIARILTSIPQAVPFDRRVKLFHSLLTADKIRTQDEAVEVREAMLAMMRGEDNSDAQNQSRHNVSIHRSDLYQDSMKQLNTLGPKLKRKIKVSFYNQHDQLEAGIDGGGVFKEFLDDLIKEAFLGNTNNDNDNNDDDTGDAVSRPSRSSSLSSGIRRIFKPRTRSTRASAAAPPVVKKPKSKTPRLFSVTPSQTLAVKTSSTGNLTLLQHYEFLGRVLGKAVYESILVEPQFCLPFLNQLLGKTNSLEDLKNYDAEYYKNLISLRHLSASDIENAGLTFELTIGDDDDDGTDAEDDSDDTNSHANTFSPSPTVQTIELVPNGRNKAVTKQNVIQYIHLVAHYRLNIQAYHQTRAFLRGFRDLIPASWVRLFSANELQKVIGGDDSIRGIDVASLKRSMQYAAGYHPSQPYVQDFWDILQNDLTPDQQRKFLKFMTSCSRQPLLGFSSLEPAPCIQQIRLPEMGDVEHSRLPTSSTCMNLLKLPNYRDKAVLRKKLLAAIESGAGFELT